MKIRSSILVQTIAYYHSQQTVVILGKKAIREEYGMKVIYVTKFRIFHQHKS